MLLTDVAIRKLKPRDKAYKVADGGGLYVFVTTAGARSFRWNYRVARRAKTLTFGLYPDVKLVEARAQAQAARAKLRNGEDPGQRASQLEGITFEEVARDWHRRKAAPWSSHHASDVLTSLEREVFGSIGAKPINTVTTADVLGALRKVEDRGAIETAHRVRQRMRPFSPSRSRAALRAATPVQP